MREHVFGELIPELKQDFRNGNTNAVVPTNNQNVIFQTLGCGSGVQSKNESLFSSTKDDKIMFDKNPVSFLRQFYSNCRHLESELATSSVGQFLGVSNLTLNSEGSEVSNRKQDSTTLGGG